MRLLHARPDPVGGRPPRRGSRQGRGGHKGIHERQSLPLRRLSAHRCGDRRRGGSLTMRPFAYSRAADERDALRAAAGEGASFIAGGTELMQLWKLGVEAPRSVIDINALPFAGIAPGEGGITIGALARLADVAGHPAVRDGYGAIAEALLASASPQIRNVATIGGNLLQRTRCAYFR